MRVELKILNKNVHVCEWKCKRWAWLLGERLKKISKISELTEIIKLEGMQFQYTEHKMQC